ncbi:MAG: hypothetical protein ACOCRK_06490 [bacterium]
MAKKTSKIHYLYDVEMQPLTKINRKNRKRRGRSRYLLSVEVTVVKDKLSLTSKQLDQLLETFVKPLPKELV